MCNHNAQIAGFRNISKYYLNVQLKHYTNTNVILFEMCVFQLAL
jgi:hypothetical protein